MIDSNEHRAALMNIAKKLSKVRQGIAKNSEGEPSETYLEYLSLLYSSEEAEIVQHLENFPNIISVRKLSQNLSRDKKELSKILEALSRKFYIMKAGGYALPTPMMVYDAPFILKVNYNRKDIRKFAQLCRTFFEKENYYKSWETSYKGTPRTRILTVSEKIEPAHGIVPLEEVYSIIDQNTSFALVPCSCRQRMEIEGIRKCKDKYPILNCIILGSMAEGLLRLNDPVIRKATKEDVIKICKEASELGLVHTTDNYAGPSTILCQCCECCCDLLAGLTRVGLQNPRAIAKANYIATIKKENCVACGTCLDRCKFNAIVVEDIAKIDEEKCMGCGLCAVTCPNDAIAMKRLERELIPGA